MKKIFGFLGAAALLTLGACSNDTLDGPKAPQGNLESQGDLFMTMNIAMVSQVGSRTSTPNQGYEVGKDYENKVSSALIILAQQEGDDYKVKFISGSNVNLVGNPNGNSGEQTNNPNNPATDGNDIDVDNSHASQYKASFLFDREALLEEITTPVTEEGDDAQHTGTKADFVIFMVANPTQAILTAAQTAAEQNSSIQSIIVAAENPARDNGSNIGENVEVFWKNNYFTMSSAQPAKKTIYSDEIPLGTHITKDDAYNLGTVRVQRVMSRFDLLTDGNHMTFAGAGNNETTGPGVAGVTISFDAVAMVNMAKSAYLYKVMAANQSSVPSTDIKFGDERDALYENFWTFTPDQEGDYFNPLFKDFVFNSTTPASSTGEYEGLDKFFAADADFQLISSLNERDNAYEHPGHSTSTDNKSYTIWRYAMENTNPDNTNNQINGNSTGIIFRAKLSGDKVPASYADGDTDKDGEAIYAYGNVILGTAEDLFTYVTTPKADPNDDVYDAVHTIYWAYLQPKYDANKKDDGSYEDTGEGAWWIQKTTNEDQGSAPEGGTAGGTITTTYHHGDLSEFDDDLVSEGFSIYRPTTENADGEKLDAPIYYCYYIYWNRHNDNGQNTIMGIMEFATVRNNVYKLSVNKVLRLGHPGQPEDDPYDPTPGTPDEKDEFWLEVECEILPWEVRINNIEF